MGKADLKRRWKQRGSASAEQNSLGGPEVEQKQAQKS